MIPIIAPIDIELDDLVILLVKSLFDESVLSISNGIIISVLGIFVV